MTSIPRKQRTCTKDGTKTKKQKDVVCIYQKNKNGNGGVAIGVNEANIKQPSLVIIIRAEDDNFAQHNDEVLVFITKHNTEKTFGMIKAIIKHNTTHLFGILQFTASKQAYLKVNDSRFGDNNYAKVSNPPSEHGNRNNASTSATDELLYNALITHYPNDDQPYFIVSLVNALGGIYEDSTLITKLIIENSIPTDFNQAAINEANSYNNHSANEALKRDKDRRDLRHLPFVTIDGEDAKDFDDAVYCVDNTLYVAIADVAYYVKAQSALDQEAYLRGNSIYLPKRVIPMLPAVLSNGLCSLNPHVDRLVMVCEVVVQNDGSLGEYKLYNAIIHSHARLTYNQVEALLLPSSAVTPQPEDALASSEFLKTCIASLYHIFNLLVHSRNQRGAINFTLQESSFIFDEHGIVKDIQPRLRLLAHQIIEECMLAANVCVADFIIQHKYQGLFRNHDKPSIDKFNTLKTYLGTLAVEFTAQHDTLTPHDYANLLNKLTHDKNFGAIQNAMLHSLQLAVYGEENIGHFGLSYTKYTHFTSPIRRYSDLIIHRILKHILAAKAYNSPLPLATIGAHTSFTERRAEELERTMAAFYRCQFANRHIGSIFTGIITNITNFGIFVSITELLLEGLIHVANLGDEYFIFDESSKTLIGSGSNKKFHIGSTITVMIKGVDMANLFVDFLLA